MNAIVANVLVRGATEARTEISPFKFVVFFCSVGLLASLCIVSLGFDVGAGFF
jgi:hypothetical protein